MTDETWYKVICFDKRTGKERVRGKVRGLNAANELIDALRTQNINAYYVPYTA